MQFAICCYEPIVFQLRSIFIENFITSNSRWNDPTFFTWLLCVYYVLLSIYYTHTGIMYISIWYVEQSVFSAMQMSDRIPNVVCSHQHDHHMNKHIVRVVPCPECINRSLHINRYAPEQVYIESSKHEAKRKRH